MMARPARPDLSIPTSGTSNTAKPYTIYNISVRQPLRSYTIQKRYSDFETLHTILLAQCGNVAPPAPLPSKNWLRSTTKNPDLAETRRQELERYMRTINEAEDPRWRSAPAWRLFLNLPSDTSGKLKGGAISDTTSRSAAELAAPVSDPSIWLDKYSDLKMHLRDARACLQRRDQATTAQGQHEASADVKRCLVRSFTIITTLERALVDFNANKDAQTNQRTKKSPPSPPRATAQLGEGELRRRRDLLFAARKERDSLEEQLNTLNVHRGAQATDVAAPSAASKQTLLQGNSKSEQSTSSTSPPKSSRRVLGGAPHKETDQTRELSNDGVLQLQQQILAEQDQDVVDMTQVVRRLKDMGVQINDELEIQNQMLRMLDGDVDRVADKVDIAKKRIDKIN